MASSHLHGLGWTLVVFFSFCCLFNCRNCAEASSRNFLNLDINETNSISSKQYRTTFHFQPLHNWINDPNGPMYYNGVYHLFYQYNPYAAIFGNISWGHSVSSDLIHWSGLPVALSPTEPYDIGGCFSGSATILPGKGPIVIYTSVDINNSESQSIAYPTNSSDPLLREWIKPDYNPVIKPDDGLNPAQFRDPTTAWLGADGLWRITVGAEIGSKGLALLYKTNDFVHWVRSKHPLLATNSTHMWECPDFYSLHGKDGEIYVLKMSLGEVPSDYYVLGRYDQVNDVFVKDDPADDYRMWQKYDYGKFYASKTFFDEKEERRILWGWLNESDSQTDDVAKGWSGIQSFPRVLTLDTNGRQLIQWPIKEIESLRRRKTSLHSTQLKTGNLVAVKGLKAFAADVEVEFELPSLKKTEPFDANLILDPAKLCGLKGAFVNGAIGPFGLLVYASDSLEEHTAIFFRVFRYSSGGYKVLMCSDQRRSSLRREADQPAYGAFVDVDIEKDGKISLRTLIDHSVIESFGAGGRACITSRVYPLLLLRGNSVNAHVYAFNNGTETIEMSELNAWELAKSRIS